MSMESISRPGCGNGLVTSPARYGYGEGQCVFECVFEFLAWSDLRCFAIADMGYDIVSLTGSLWCRAKRQKRCLDKVQFLRQTDEKEPAEAIQSLYQ